MNSLVSIITPTFNSEKFISETIKSVQNQTYENWEMIIVDDFSSDKTTDIVILALNADRRIKLFKLEKNSGAGVARNTALEKASGKYIAFL
ncbi:MAG: glycosyltransferase family 2 protein, partial [Pedobacter sp.]